MEDTGISPTTEVHRSRLVAAPKDYFLGPVFAATRQLGPREVVIGGRRYSIGGFHPLRPDLSPPALDVRHARAIFSLLSFRDPFEDTRLIRFSFNEFCRRYANSNGGRYARAIAGIVADLLDAYIRVTDQKSGIAHEYLESAILGKCPTEITQLTKPLPAHMNADLRSNIAAAAVGKSVKIVAKGPRTSTATSAPSLVAQS